MAPRPEHPWHARSFQFYGINKRAREVWATDHRSGERVRRKKPRFDVRYRVDGHDFRFGFDQKGWADSFVLQLKEGFAHGWPFDPHARKFVDPKESA